jgi:asparagine synthetase B (glutamine-hydrolysing)
VATARGAEVETHGQASVRLGTPAPGRDPIDSDGVFATWDWDGSRLSARNDRYGAYPLFYFVSDGTIGLSPSIPRLLAEGAPTELDDRAWAVFLRLGFFLGEDTPFRAIRALPPAGELRWTAGQLAVDGGLFLTERSDLDRDAAIDGYLELFRTAVARRLPFLEETFAHPLSGGRDSRHILLELCHAGRPPAFCASVRHHPPRTDQDAEIAAQLSARLGIPHVAVEQRQSRFEAELRKNLRTSFCTDEGTHFLALSDVLADRTSSVFDGMAGDVLSAGLFLSEARLALFRAGRLRELAEHLLGDERRISSLLDEAGLRRFSRELAVERLVEELARHTAAPNPVGSFYFWNRTRREIALAPFALYDTRLRVLCPYLDHDVYDLLSSLPAEMLVDHTFHTDAIHRAFPGLADVPFESYDRLYRFDAVYRDYFARLVADVRAYLATEPSSLLSAAHVDRRLSECLAAGWEPHHFTDHAIYVLQLERTIRATRQLAGVAGPCDTG